MTRLATEEEARAQRTFAVVIGYVQAADETEALPEAERGARKMFGRWRWRRVRKDVHLQRVRTPIRAATAAARARD